MPRLSRLVVPGYPHHITQRGVRSMDIFTDDEDRTHYLGFMAEESSRFGVNFMGWCLMSNHVHLIAAPEHEESLARAVGEAHRRYTRMKNFTSGVRGYLFQGRFSSCVMDEDHLLAAGRYIERNPVRANMVEYPQAYKWSSFLYNCGLLQKDPLVRERRLPKMVDDWRAFIANTDEKLEQNVRQYTRTGRPAGDDAFVLKHESCVGRVLRKKPPGRRRKLE